MPNPYAPKGRATRVPSIKDTEVEVKSPESSEVEVPTGSVSEILEWVGEDKDRASSALALETSKDKPRKSLVTSLEELIA